MYTWNVDQSRLSVQLYRHLGKRGDKFLATANDWQICFLYVINQSQTLQNVHRSVRLEQWIAMKNFNGTACLGWEKTCHNWERVVIFWGHVPNSPRLFLTNISTIRLFSVSNWAWQFGAVLQNLAKRQRPMFCLNQIEQCFDGWHSLFVTGSDTTCIFFSSITHCFLWDARPKIVHNKLHWKHDHEPSIAQVVQSGLLFAPHYAG